MPSSPKKSPIRILCFRLSHTPSGFFFDDLNSAESMLLLSELSTIGSGFTSLTQRCFTASPISGSTIAWLVTFFLTAFFLDEVCFLNLDTLFVLWSHVVEFFFCGLTPLMWRKEVLL